MGNMFLRIFIAILLGLIVIELLLIGAQFANSHTYKTPQPTPKISVLATPVPLSSPKPPFFTNPIQWNFADSKDPNSMQNTQLLYLESNPLPGIKITGIEWISEHENITNEKLAELKDIETEYLKTLNELNWKQSIDIQNKQLSAISADGALGGITGNLKSDDKNLTVLVLDGQIIKSESSSNAAINCPCNYTMRIFMSNPIPLSELDRYLKE